MDTKSLLSLVDQLEENIEDLEDHLAPLLEGESDFATTTKKLPVLDRAKLNVLVVYAIESLLFSYLKLQGVDAKDHAVFRELTRVKQYFEKISNAEPSATTTTTQPSVTLNKEAAERVIKHALAGNDKYDLERAEREARERFLANKKLKTLEASMKERAKAKAKEEKDAETADALQLAAQLASVPQPASSEISSSSEDESDEDDDEESDDEGDNGVPLPGNNPQSHSSSGSGSVPDESFQNQHDQYPAEEQASTEQTPQSKRGKKRKLPLTEAEVSPNKMSKKALGKEKARAHRAEQAARKAKRQAKKKAQKAEQKTKNLEAVKRQAQKKAKKEAKKKAAASAGTG